MGNESSGRLGRFLKGSSIIFVGFIIQLGLGFVGKLLIGRLLGNVNYGLVNIGVTVMSTAGIILLLGLDTGISRYLPRQERSADRRGVLVSAFSVVMPVALIAGVLMAVFAGDIASIIFKDPAAEPIIQIFAMTLPVMILIRLTGGTIRGQQEALPRVLLQNIGLPVVRFGLIVVVVLALGLGAGGVSKAYLGAYALIGLGALYYLYRYTNLFDRTPATPMRRKLLVFSAPLIIASTMNMIHANIDVFILGFFQSTGEIGVYTAVYPLSKLLKVGLTTFGFLFMPLISELHSNGERGEMRRTYQIVSKWVLLMTLPVLLVYLTYPDIVIRYTFGPEYISGGLPLAVLSIGFFAHTVSGPSGDTLTAQGKSKLVMIDNIVVAVVNVGLNLILVPRYSVLGAAIATTVAFLAMNSLYVIQLYRSIGVHPFRRATLGPALGSIAVWVGLTQLVGAVWTVTGPLFLLLTTVFGVVYLGLILVLGGIEAEEVDLIEKGEERTGIDLGGLRAVFDRFSQ
ncbi:flippase [Halocatena marina]|uniref:flippase n=1 Tax=Halocatena marina TaxID=2934937 RepID=UPI002224A220|nr:flippase [Halocatena marina]